MWRFVCEKRGRIVLAAVSVVTLVVSGCHRDVEKHPGAPAASASGVSPTELSPELSSRVLAKVGEHAITLGDYAQTLEHMDRFERLRYQTADRRKQLLDEMIDVELLAREAERRGLAAKPETRELVRQILRDELRREIREKEPPLEQIPAGEVRAYYDAHPADFKEPERRRISHVVTRDRATAERVLGEAKASTAPQWGDLVQRYSVDKPAVDVPVELAGDLGMITPPSAGKNDNLRVPEALRTAAFEIEKPSQVLPRVVAEGNLFHVVRLTGKNEPRARSIEEADRSIRVRLMQDRIHAAEQRFEAELRTRFPVQVDDQALRAVPVPSGTPP